MKNILFVSNVILVFLFVPLGWCGALDYGQGAKAFTDGFFKTYNAGQDNSRANEELNLKKQELELRKKELELQQKNTSEIKEYSKNISLNNGTAWNNYDDTMKIFYIYAFTNAASYITVSSLGNENDFLNKENKAIKKIADKIDANQEKKQNVNFSKNEILTWGKAMFHYGTDIQNDILKNYMIPGVTVGQIIEGLNILYKDFKNATVIIPDGIYIVNKQIKGASSEEIEAILQYLRSGRDFNKLQYTDKDGKQKMAIFP